MCFHMSISKNAMELVNRFDLSFPDQDLFSPSDHVNGFAHSLLPVISSGEPDHLQMMNWGMVPSWVNSQEKAKTMKNITLNARSETIFEKPSFRHSIMAQRCLVPAEAYYEWQHRDGKKIPYKISMDRDVFCFAGIYDRWENDESGEIYSGFSVITCPANSLMETIHNSKKRMPVILPLELESSWINPELPRRDIQTCLLPYPSQKMSAQSVEM